MIDVGAGMVIKHEEASAPGSARSSARLALESVYQVMLERIISNPDDLFGVTLFNSVGVCTFHVVDTKGQDQD